MSTPRVFISSTYYDLKHVRNDIGDFIKSLGYEPVMHDKGGVAYTQTDTLENSCYTELSNCNIVVCIIGNHFGTQSTQSNFSITMEELRTAIKNKKKIYIFIAKDVYIENRTYQQNKGTGTFKSAYTDDLKIHEFIDELKASIKSNPIEPFETTSDIVNSLKLQFAGLFENLLAREASLTDAKTAYDLQETAEAINDLIVAMRAEKDEFFQKFDSTILVTNLTLTRLRSKLGMTKSLFFAKDKDALDEFLQIAGFVKQDSGLSDDEYRYTRENINRGTNLELKSELFNEDGSLKDFRKTSIVDGYIIWDEYEIDNELPF